MCGIAGFVDFTNKSNEGVLKKMTSSLHHRGPDGDGLHLQNTAAAQVGLGHRRLSIIDLSEGGSQPMHYDGLHITFNGEIYNYSEIKDELLAKGHQFHSTSDTEVILHAIREWGIEAVQKWKGMFAIVLFDERKNELLCIRDRAGVKPFHYYYADGLFVFGSELKAVMAHPAFPKEISKDALASFLRYGYVSQPYTIFQNTYKLRAGHYLTLNLSDRQLAEHQYWNVYDYYNRPKLSISLPDAIEQTEAVLKKSFDYRMVADVPVGVFLSGGYDSTCVTALLQKGRTEKIKTFTIGSTDKSHNEAVYAKEVASYLGTDHTEYICTPQEALDIIPELPYYYDEPFADSSAIPTILVSRVAREKVTVALSADAGDETFAGYNRHDYLVRYGQKIRAIPKPVRSLAAMVMENVSSNKIPYLRDQYLFHSRYDKVKNLLNNPTPDEILKNLTQIFTNKDFEKLMQTPVTELVTAHSSKELVNGYKDDLSYILAIDYQTYMVDDILQKVDRATMSTSLEGREPFLDQDIIEWAAQLPSEYKYNKGEKKYILKQIVHRHIPQQMMERPKMGFSVPIEKWLQNELKELVLQYLSEPMIKVHGLFYYPQVKSLVDDFFAGHTEKHLKVWHLLMFQMWYHRWMA